jgi:hypothetical protein
LLTAAAIGAAVSAGTLVAQASQQALPDEQPSLVEDFSYPGAQGIQATTGVVLISGDGHILFADCNTPPANNIGLMQVHTIDEIGTNHDGRICFKVTASTGRLELRIPAVYEIRGDGQVAGTGHQATAGLTTDDGTRTTVAVNPSGSTPVGVGASPGNKPTTLLTLTVTG